MWGPPKDLMTLQQEVGRCARDGNEGRAIIYLIPRSTSPKLVDEEMKMALKNMSTNCIRSTVLKYFIIPDYQMDTKALTRNRLPGTCWSICDS